MGNINELYEERKRKEEEKKENQLLYMQYMALASKDDDDLNSLTELNTKKRKAIRSACKINNIPHYEHSIILLIEDRKKNIYSTYDWFGNDFIKGIITEFMESINEPLVLDENGNPTNDIEWHFYNYGTALYDVLKEKGYLEKGNVIKKDSDNDEMMKIHAEMTKYQAEQRIKELQQEMDELKEKMKNFEE